MKNIIDLSFLITWTYSIFWPDLFRYTVWLLFYQKPLCGLTSKPEDGQVNGGLTGHLSHIRHWSSFVKSVQSQFSLFLWYRLQKKTQNQIKTKEWKIDTCDHDEIKLQKKTVSPSLKVQPFPTSSQCFSIMNERSVSRTCLQREY